MARTDGIWEVSETGDYIKMPGDGYDVLINGLDRYLNFNDMAGFPGYGFRDNGGVMEFKNDLGVWAPIGTGTGSGTVTSVTADGSLVVTVDNTDPANPVVQFGGVFTDGVTITGDGHVFNPLTAHSGEGTSFLTYNQIAFGDPANIMTSTVDFQYNIAAQLFEVGFGGTGYLLVNPLASFYAMGNPLGTRMELNDSGATSFSSFSNFFYANGLAGERYMLLGGGFYQIGDLSGSNNKSQFTINDAAQTFTMSGISSSRYFVVDPNSQMFQFGDIDNGGNGDFFEIGKNRFTFFGKPGGIRSLNFDQNANTYEIGDIDSSNVNSTLLIDDAGKTIYARAQQFITQQPTGEQFIIATLSSIQMGDLSFVGNNTTLGIFDSSELMQFSVMGNRYLDMNVATQTYAIGDLDGVAGNNYFTITDGSGDILAHPTYGFTITDGTNTPFVAYTFANQVYLSGNAYPNNFGTTGDILYTDGAGTNFWSAPPAASVVAIGLPITGTSPNQVLFMDSSNNLAQTAQFYYNPDIAVDHFTIGFPTYGDIKFNIDAGIGSYQLGSLPGNIGGFGTYLDIVDGSQHIDHYSNTFTANQIGTGLTYIYADYQPGGTIDMRLGDSGFAVNGTQFLIQDAIQTIQANAAFFKVADASSSVRFSIDTSTGAPTIGGFGAYTLPSSGGSLGDVLTAGFAGSTSWSPVPTSSIGIGTTITASTPWELLFVDGSNQLAQDSGLIFQPVSGGSHPFTFHISLNSTNVFDINNTSGQAKIGNYGGGGVGPAYATFDWGTTGNTQFRNFGTFSVADSLGNQSFRVTPTTNTVRISNAFDLPTGATPLNGVMTLTSSGVAGWQLIPTASLASHAVTYAKIQQVNANRILGNPTGSLADVSEISLGASLGFSAGSLNALLGSTRVGFGNASGFMTDSSSFIYDDVTAHKFNVSLAAHQYLTLDQPNGRMQIGDITAASNKVWLDLRPVFNNTILYSGNQFQVQSGTNQMLSLDNQFWQYSIGDISGANHSTYMNISDLNQQLSMASAGHLMFSADWINSFYKFGDSASGNHGDRIEIDDTTANQSVSLFGGKNVVIKDNVGHQFGNFGNASGTITLGDISGVFSGSQISMDMVNNMNTMFGTLLRNRWSGVNDFLIDSQNFNYYAGDFGGNNNHSYWRYNDATQTFTLNTGGVVVFQVDNQVTTLKLGRNEPNIQFADYGTSTNLLLTDYNLQIGAAGSGATSVTLDHTIPVGALMIVSDYGAAALTNNITIDAGTGHTIHGTTIAQTYVISLNGGSVQLRKVTSTSWKIE